MTPPRARRLAAGLAACAAAVVVALEPIRAAAIAPDVMWLVVLVGCLVTAASLAAHNAPGNLPPARRLLLGRVLIVLGAVAAGAGGVATSEASYPADVRVAAALAVLLAFALLPGGFVLARDAARELRRGHGAAAAGAAR